MRGVKSPKRRLTILMIVALKNRTLIIPIGSSCPATKYRNAVNGSISQGKNLMYPRLTSFVINGPWYRSTAWFILRFFDFFFFQNQVRALEILSFSVKTLAFFFLSIAWINVFLLYHKAGDADRFWLLLNVWNLILYRN